jgi:hypothetical protein
MFKKAPLLVLFLFSFSFSFSQLCPDCDYSIPLDDDPRFWKDPNGLIYDHDEILVPNVIGNWTFFKIRENNDLETIFTREVYCIGNLDNRSSDSILEDVKLFPNPVSEELTISHSYEKGQIFITDVKGVILFSKDIKNKSNININTSTYNKGIYLLHLTTNSEKINKFFVVE